MSIDLSGEWIFITRFLHPLAPPEELLTANKESIETLVKHFLVYEFK